MSLVDSKTYLRVFGDGDGAALLDHLTLTYWKNPYQHDDRDPIGMAFRAGQMAVIDHIIHHLNEAQNGNDR